MNSASQTEWHHSWGLSSGKAEGNTKTHLSAYWDWTKSSNTSDSPSPISKIGGRGGTCCSVQ